MTVLTLSVNVHGVGPEAAATPADRLLGRFAHGRYAYSSGLRRLLDFLRDRELQATFFWPTGEIERAGALFDACLADGHEVAAHGEAFEDLSALEPAAEEDLLARMTETLARRTGRCPEGFRSATGTLSERTLPQLGRLGYRWDASFVDDDAPYRLDGDGAPGMVELPWFEGLSDATYFRRRMTQARAEAFLVEELDALLPVAGYGALVLHPRSDIGTARAARIGIVDRLLDRAAERHGAVVVTCGEAAARALTAA